MLTAGRLARRFALSRTALLYYDRIGLLRPQARTASGYRCYSDVDVARLEQICTLRGAGLRLGEIKQILAGRGNVLTRVLERRLEELNGEIDARRSQQRFILGLLKTKRARSQIRVMNKELWVSLLEAAGFSSEDRSRWHAEFERLAPERHQEFLEFLCLTDQEIAGIRQRAGMAAA